MDRLPPGLHRVDELLAYARRVTDAPPVYSFRLALPDAAVEACEAMIEKYRLRDGSVIALNVGASRATKRWPAARFRALAVALVARGHRVAFTGAREFSSDGHYDRAAAAEFADRNPVDGETCVDLITEGNLPPALQLQRDTHFFRYSGIPRVVVGNDTGPMHLAGSVGDDARRRTVSIFGPTNWGRYAPYDPTRIYPDRTAGDWNRVVCADLECRPRGTTEACPYYRRGCPRGIACMAELPVDAVLEAVLERLPSTPRTDA
jgi:ADP-heptose:LPS heptosyltransferase